MALIATRYDVPFSLSLDGVYVRIKNVGLVPTENQVLMDVEFYLNKEAREAAKEYIKASQTFDTNNGVKPEDISDEDWEIIIATKNRAILPIVQCGWGCKISDFGIADIAVLTDRDKAFTAAYDYAKNNFGFQNTGYEDD